ncbi:MAG: AMP-binding protein [Flavobacteriaceae bacterium]|nr:AMP-binding protein [Flavobacteriaceae bacterium]
MNLILHKNFKINSKSFNTVASLLFYIKENEVASYPFLEQWFTTKNYITVQTSGSTGKPKQLKILKKHMVNSAIATGNYFGLDKKTTALLCLSPNYIAGKMMLVRALVLGWQLDIVAPKSNPLDKKKEHYDFCAMVPMQVLASLNDLYKIKQLIVGGGAVSNNVLEKLQTLKTKVFATYGMTETVTHIAIKKLNHCDLKKSNFEILLDIKISKDKRGCLVIDAPKITSEQVITNDLVVLVGQKSFKWLGRFDHIINSGGIKILPEQVEEQLSKIMNIQFFIASEKDEVLGEKVVLIVEGIEIENLKSKIENLKSLSRFKKPKNIYYVNKFIRTSTAKIDRNKNIELLFK